MCRPKQPISLRVWCRRTGASSRRCGGRCGTPSIWRRSARRWPLCWRFPWLIARRAQHNAECRSGPAGCLVHHCFVALDQCTDLGADAGHDHWAGCARRFLAIALRSVGFCAKLLYEPIEEINERQVEAIRATGASRAQVATYGIVPQVLPAFAGISVFRWDINIRESTVLGLVGAGGIGLPLNAAITTLAWTRVSLILLIILATVVISEWISAKVRHAII